MTELEATEKLSEMLPRLYAWRVELDKIEKASTKDQSQPFPPASEAEIRAAESKVNFKFPPSYRAFLKLHNGWKNFNFRWWVSGVSGPAAAVQKEWIRACAAFDKRLSKKGTAYVDGLRAESKTNPSVMYWPDHVPCAADFTGGFMVFDRTRALKGGEYEIAEVARREEAANRLPSFIAYAEMVMDIMRSELKDHGRNPETIGPVTPDVTHRPTRVAKAEPSAAPGRPVPKKRLARGNPPTSSRRK
jgi:cell wall assembly regulator SMI1